MFVWNRRSRWGGIRTEPIDQVVTADGAQESKPEIYVGEPLPLGQACVFKLS